MSKSITMRRVIQLLTVVSGLNFLQKGGLNVVMASSNAQNVMDPAKAALEKSIREKFQSPAEVWLGVNKQMTRPEVQKRIKGLAHEFHPDLGGRAEDFDKYKKYVDALRNTEWYKNLK